MLYSPRLARGAAGGALAASLILGPVLGAAAAPLSALPDCLEVDGRLQITAECVDATYAQPVIDSATEESLPVPHHRVNGHFDGTNIQFTVYLHAEADKSEWQGRFFQSTYPIAFSPDKDTSKATDRQLEFALASGGYAVAAGNIGVSVGYRHTAAAAKVAREIAQRYYAHDGPIYGYLTGGSGGSFQTVGAAENTTGVWQGFVPTIQAVPQPTSYNFQGRSAAELILADKADAIRSAVLPGGSGDPYLGLDPAEQAMLREVTALGIPLQAWENPAYLLGQDPAYFPTGLASSAPLDYDPTYADDFWGAPGYLGTEASPLGDRVRSELAERGDTVDNRWNIANRFYYRYQLPAAEEGWRALDQFRASDGTPLTPQRPVVAPISTSASGGATFDGDVHGKVIAVSNLYDVDALPWHTDWYRQRIERSLGSAAADSYRIYYNDHADHQDPPVPGEERSKHLVDWFGSTEQALRDVAAWVEDGVAPPESTQYSITGAQVVVPADASERRGIQPTVDLEVDGDSTVTVQAGQEVSLVAAAHVPPGAGAIVRAEWDLDGDGIFTEAAVEDAAPDVTVGTSTTFDEVGTRFVAVRVTSERSGDASDAFAGVQNLDRVRVVVTPAPTEPTPAPTEPPVTEPTVSPTPAASPAPTTSTAPVAPAAPGGGGGSATAPSGLAATGTSAVPGALAAAGLLTLAGAALVLGARRLRTRS